MARQQLQIPRAWSTPGSRHGFIPDIFEICSRTVSFVLLLGHHNQVQVQVSRRDEPAARQP